MTDPYSIDWNKLAEDFIEHMETISDGVFDIKQALTDYDEHGHAYRWWSAFNAALPQAMAMSVVDDELNVKHAVSIARAIATEAHGELE